MFIGFFGFWHDGSRTRDTHHREVGRRAESGRQPRRSDPPNVTTEVSSVTHESFSCRRPGPEPSCLRRLAVGSPPTAPSRRRSTRSGATPRSASARCITISRTNRALAAPVYAQVRSYVTPTGRCRQFQHPDVGIVGDVNVLTASTATLSGWLRPVDFAKETTPSTNESTNR
jgi:hypothetical protein